MDMGLLDVAGVRLLGRRFELAGASIVEMELCDGLRERYMD